MTPEDAQRVEDVAQHSGLYERGDVPARQLDVAVGKERVDALPQRFARPGGGREVVACLEFRERTQPAWKFRQIVQVDVPAVPALLEVMVDGFPAQVGDAGPVQRWASFGCRHAATTSRRLAG